MTESLRTVVPLAGLSSADLDSAGGKGANLGELIAAGLPVPDGFVVTTAGYDLALDALGLAEAVARGAASEVADALGRGQVSYALARNILDAYRTLGGGPVAVRSSATAEDLPDASFAGQQDTYLNISGGVAVLDAVRRCWASLWGERAVAYREQRQTGAPPRIAVVVQRLVPAEVAGVMFTANPGNGRRNETVITAAWGLGESVVGGQVEPDEYVLDRDHPDAVRRRIADKQVMTVTTADGVQQQATDGAKASAPTLTDAQVRDLAALGARVERHFGVPQDIEWVLADGAFQLVQARPITALPEPTGEVPTDWPLPREKSMCFRASITEQLPDPLTPLFADLIRPAVPAGLDALLALFDKTVAATDVEFPTVNGYAYYDYSPAGMNRMWRLTPAALKLLTSRDFVLTQWHDTALPAYRDAVAAWQDSDPAALPAGTLLQATRDLLDAGCRYYSNVQMVIPMAASSEVIWTRLHDTALHRAGDPAASDYLLGYDSAPMRAEKSLHSLGVWCRDVPGLADAIGSLPAGPLPAEPPDGVAADAWAAFTDRFAAHLAEYGHTIYNLDFANPVPADDPAPVLESLKHAVAGRGVDPVQRQRTASARRERITAELFDRLDPVRERLARTTLGRAQRWAPLREDALAAMGLAWPTMRRLLHELGRRLVDAGAVTDVDDVFWLTEREADAAASALDAGATTLDDASARIAERRMTWRGQRLATPPQYLPQQGWITRMESMMPARSGQTGPVLSGTGGSGGRVTAPARVLEGPQDFASFEPGEILVASITTPAYTPLFAIAAGVVTDIGGVLSHGSIVAREYGIPAVLGTGNATRRIATGDVITVDGAAGTVHLDSAPDTPAAESSNGLPAWLIATGASAVAAGVVVAIARRRRRAG